MHFHSPSPCEFNFVRAAFAGAAIVLLAIAVQTARAPLSSPFSDLEIQRQLLAGSDALLERMVIPPNRPDWFLMDCSHSPSKASTYDRIRHSLCEAAGKTDVASTDFN